MTNRQFAFAILGYIIVIWIIRLLVADAPLSLKHAILYIGAMTIGFKIVDWIAINKVR